MTTNYPHPSTDIAREFIDALEKEFERQRELDLEYDAERAKMKLAHAVIRLLTEWA